MLSLEGLKYLKMNLSPIKGAFKCTPSVFAPKGLLYQWEEGGMYVEL